jgi:uridine phosphorylase
VVTRFPNFPGKHGEDSMIEPADYVAYMRRIQRFPTFRMPESVVLCYQRSLMEHIVKEHKTSKGDGFLSEMLLLDDTDGRIGVMGKFGIGAPAAVAVMEELIVCGVKRFLTVGTAGTLQKDIQVGDLVVCEKAIRDEGTSHHYLPAAKYAHPSESLTNQVMQALTALGKSFRYGSTWTTDAPYRETIAEARQYQAEGVCTVEMEASALFAVASHRKVEVASVFTVTDSLADLKWHPDFHGAKPQTGLEVLYKAACMALMKDS